MFEIRTVKEYPENYKQCTDIAAEEDRTNARPELRGTLPDMSGYNTIITKYAVLYKDIHFQKRHGCRWFQSEATFWHKAKLARQKCTRMYIFDVVGWDAAKVISKNSVLRQR